MEFVFNHVSLICQVCRRNRRMPDSFRKKCYIFSFLPQWETFSNFGLTHSRKLLWGMELKHRWPNFCFLWNDAKTRGVVTDALDILRMRNTMNSDLSPIATELIQTRNIRKECREDTPASDKSKKRLKLLLKLVSHWPLQFLICVCVFSLMWIILTCTTKNKG